jgi:hypothetical protein
VRSESRRSIPRPVRRAVFERDGERCTFVDAEGRRCNARAYLELDHIRAKAVGGADDATNLRVRCRGHNRLEAEKMFGREHIAQKIHLRQRKNQTRHLPAFDAAAYGLKRMGIREPDVKRALATVRASLEPSKASIEAIVREALSILT